MDFSDKKGINWFQCFNLEVFFYLILKKKKIKWAKWLNVVLASWKLDKLVVQRRKRRDFLKK